MGINSIIVTFWFNKVTDIKNKIEIFEEELNEYFHGINSIGVPADISPDYPRLTAISDGGHTNLKVSMINLQITTNFDKDYNCNYEDCFNYVRNRIFKIYNLLANKLDITVLYGAILAMCEVDCSNPMHIIKKNLLSQKLNGDYCDSGVRISEIIDNKFYENSSFNTTKQISIKKEIGDFKNIIIPLISLNNAIVEKKGISISYELNDKYSFDNNDDYHLDYENLKQMITTAQENITNKILDKISENKIGGQNDK